MRVLCDWVSDLPHAMLLGRVDFLFVVALALSAASKTVCDDLSGHCCLLSLSVVRYELGHVLTFCAVV